jgi:hypothetical protein
MTTNSGQVLLLRFTPSGLGLVAAAPVERKFRVHADLDLKDLLASIRSVFQIAATDDILLSDDDDCIVPTSRSLMTTSASYTVSTVPKLSPSVPLVHVSARKESKDTVRGSTLSKEDGSVGSGSGAALPASFPVWPDGKQSWVATLRKSQEKTLLYTGWAIAWGKSRTSKVYRTCRGVLKCPQPDCAFTARPPTKKKALQKAIATRSCKFHNAVSVRFAKLAQSFARRSWITYSVMSVSTWRARSSSMTSQACLCRMHGWSISRFHSHVQPMTPIP